MTQVKHGATDQTFYFKLIDSTTGVPETGLTITNIDATYVRARAAAVKNDLTALGAANSAHADNQAIEVDATNAPGLYRIDFPDAAFASGADKVILSVTCSGCDPAMKEIELVANTAEDVYTRIGAPAGASVSADIAAIEAQTDDIGAAGAGLTALASAADLATLAGYVDTEIAALTTAVADLPTNAELATALGTADDAVLTAIDALPTATENADALLNRDMSAVSDTNARSPLNALRFIRNKWDVAAGTLTVKKEDDTTTAWTASVSTDAGAEPVIGNDPA
jgi:hypothetical protein